jgi:hypothetical protein
MGSVNNIYNTLLHQVSIHFKTNPTKGLYYVNALELSSSAYMELPSPEAATIYNSEKVAHFQWPETIDSNHS